MCNVIPVGGTRPTHTLKKVAGSSFPRPVFSKKRRAYSVTHKGFACARNFSLSPSLSIPTYYPFPFSPQKHNIHTYVYFNDHGYVYDYNTGVITSKKITNIFFFVRCRIMAETTVYTYVVRSHYPEIRR